MSLADIEKQVWELPAAERHEFVSWVYAHEEELVDPPFSESIASDVMEELLRRRQELEVGNVQTFTIAETRASMKAAVDEVRSSRH